MSANCPTCGQPWPERRKRICTACDKPVRKHDKYRMIAGRIVHRDCNNPTLTTVVQSGAGQRTLEATR